MIDLSGQTSGADFSPDGIYRYSLWREWAPLADRLCALLLNPSTATEFDDDPTVAKLGRYARRWGFGSLEVVNMYAFRATDPREMMKAEDPIGPLNNLRIFDAIRRARVTLCAWGNHAKHLNRDADVREMLRSAPSARGKLRCLALNKDGSPVHPLYQRDNQRMVEFLP